MKIHAAALELFPELAVPALEKPARAKRAGKRPGTDPVIAPVAQAPEPDFESLAQLLEGHADYRIQRRLRPQLSWPGEPAGRVVGMLLLDTETTGLDPAKERIIELAMLRVDVDAATGLPVGAVQVYDGLEDPGKPIPPEVVALTGIRDADVQGQALDESRILQLLEGVDLIVAHNAGFDRPFVENRLARFADFDWACSVADIDWKVQGYSSAKLENLAQSHGWFYDAHRAEMDCHALLAVLAQKLPAAPHTGLSELLGAAGRSSYALQATQAPFEAKDALKGRGYRWNAEQRVWHTRLKDEAALAAESEWLKQQVYGARSAVVRLEKQSARVRFSNRPGLVTQHVL